MPQRYYALACQTIVRPITEDVQSRSDGRAIIKENLDAALNLMWKGLGNNLGNAKLVTFPEMFLTLAPVGWRNRPSSDWLDLACMEVPGPELEPLCQAARDAGIHIAANAYEYDPVADTELGRIAMFPCMEVVFPEVARMYALQGAEIFINPTNDSPDVPGWVACKQARALENNCYLISTNAGGWVSRRGLLESTNAGGTIIVDYKGSIIEAHRPAGESMKARALIDIEQLRAYRLSTSAMNFIPQLRTELYKGYQKTMTPPNRFKDPMNDHAELRKLYSEVMARLTDEGIYRRPVNPDI